MKILVVENDKGLRDMITARLREEEYEVAEAAAGDEGLFLAQQGGYDLAVMAAALPGLTGLEAVKELQRQGSPLPVLLLAEGNSAADRVLGLESGADDCLGKPFVVAELLARVHALLRRGRRENREAYGGITLDARRRQGLIGGNSLELTGKEYDLLEFLLVNKEQVLSREQIFSRVWGLTSETGLGIVDLYVHYLRKKLACHGRDHVIKTVRGVGFLLTIQTHEGGDS